VVVFAPTEGSVPTMLNGSGKAPKEGKMAE